jgi:hypothetical protein
VALARNVNVTRLANNRHTADRKTKLNGTHEQTNRA